LGVCEAKLNLVPFEHENCAVVVIENSDLANKENIIDRIVPLAGAISDKQSAISEKSKSFATEGTEKKTVSSE